MVKYYLYDIQNDEIDAIQYLSQKIRKLKVPEERIYKIIKIEVD